MFTLDADSGELEEYPILVKALSGTTQDTDRITADNPTGLIAAGEGFTLIASVGLIDATLDDAVAFVSPLTTLAEYERRRIASESAELTSAEALQRAVTSIETALGIAADTTFTLSTDYIAIENTEDADLAESGKLVHTVARIVSGVAGDIEQESIAAVAGDSTINVEEAMGVGFSLLFKQLPEIVLRAAEILADIDTLDLNAQDLAAELTLAVAAEVRLNEVVEIDEIGNLIAVDQADETVTTAAAAFQVEGGLVLGEVLKAEGENGGYDVLIGAINFGYDAEAEESLDFFYYYDALSGESELDEVIGTSVLMLDDGWSEQAYDPIEWTLSDDGSVTGDSDTGSYKLASAASGVVLDGLSVGAMVATTSFAELGGSDMWLDIIDADALFTAPAKGYELTLTTSENREVNVDDWGLGVTTTNNVLLTSLAAMINEDGARVVTDAGTLNLDPATIHIGKDRYQPSRLLMLLQGGSATFVLETYSATGDAEYATVGSSTYTQSTLNGESILSIAGLAVLSDMMILHTASSTLKAGEAMEYTIYQGGVYPVQYDQAVTRSTFALNATAADDLFAAFDAERILNTNRRSINEDLLDYVSDVEFPIPATSYQAIYDDDSESIVFYSITYQADNSFTLMGTVAANVFSDDFSADQSVTVTQTGFYEVMAGGTVLAQRFETFEIEGADGEVLEESSQATINGPNYGYDYSYVLDVDDSVSQLCALESSDVDDANLNCEGDFYLASAVKADLDAAVAELLAENGE